MQLESIFSFVLPSFHPLDFFYSHKFQRKLQGICVYIYIYIYICICIYICVYIYIYIYIYIYNRHIHAYYENLHNGCHGKFQSFVQLLHSNTLFLHEDISSMFIE